MHCREDGDELRRESTVKCLDTDFLVAVLRGREDVQSKMTEIDLEGRQSTTSVTAFELFFGAYKSAERRNKVEKTRVLLERLDVLPFDLKSSESAGEALARLSARGETKISRTP